jgi:hypothetical protein
VEQELSVKENEFQEILLCELIYFRHRESIYLDGKQFLWAAGRGGRRTDKR